MPLRVSELLETTRGAIVLDDGSPERSMSIDGGGDVDKVSAGDKRVANTSAKSILDSEDSMMDGG